MFIIDKREVLKHNGWRQEGSDTSELWFAPDNKDPQGLKLEAAWDRHMSNRPKKN